MQKLLVVHSLHICGLFCMYCAFLYLLAPWYVMCSFVCLLALFFRVQGSFAQSVAETRRMPYLYTSFSAKEPYD